MDEYSFDFEPSDNNSEIVAHIVKGKDKGKSIYLNKQKHKENKDNKIDELLDFIEMRRFKLSKNKLDILIENVLNDEEPVDTELKFIYNMFNKMQSMPKEIKLEGEIEPVPYQGDEKNVQRDVLFISACSGAGKSTFISRYCHYFNKLYPTSPIYVISCKPIEDEVAYKNIKRMKQIDISEENLQDIVDNTSYKHFISRTGQSLLIFDDFDGVDKKISTLINVILSNVLQLGRSSRIYTIVSKHVLNNGKETKLIWSEANKIILFPHGLAKYNLTYAMKHYLGFDSMMINKVLNNKSRWIVINNHLPKYYITQNSISLL